MAQSKLCFPQGESMLTATSVPKEKMAPRQGASSSDHQSTITMEASKLSKNSTKRHY